MAPATPKYSKNLVLFLVLAIALIVGARACTIMGGQ